MGKDRVVNTAFWIDEYTASLGKDEKLLFLYFLTNPLTHICGIYRILIKTICTDTGFTEDEVKIMLNRFEDDEKIMYRNGWVAIKNFIKHQSKKGNIEKGIVNGLKEAPVELKEWVLKPVKGFSSPSKPVEQTSTESKYINSNLDSNSNLNKEYDVASDFPDKASSEDQEEKVLYNTILKSFHFGYERQTKLDSFSNYGKEGKSIKTIIERAFSQNKDSPVDFIRNIIRYYWYLVTHSNHKYFKEKPFLPSQLVGDWDQVVTRMQKEKISEEDDPEFTDFIDTLNLKAG